MAKVFRWSVSLDKIFQNGWNLGFENDLVVDDDPRGQTLERHELQRIYFAFWNESQKINRSLTVPVPGVDVASVKQ